MESLGSRIKQLRLRAKLNKAALARKVGVSDVTVSYWESGAIKQIGHERLVALAEALECSLATLLEGETTSTALLPLQHEGPLPWHRSQQAAFQLPPYLPLAIQWQQACFIVTPAPKNSFPPLEEGELALLGPTREFHQPGHYVVENEVVENEQRFNMQYLEQPPKTDAIRAILLGRWQPSTAP
ncbi:helix-turn-helix domain-containing protein [Halomonas sp. ZH2S]|uniref:Helix-turn-helix domain-containing protein n=1 Tax=Vreelandella zhuhanensis TaxID=2684210 RepID=A0A7X3H304_9GAMM|nr:helix-turn-helix domain-containing protein [Halomonas zhuhanensis]MWJ29436.1 helix-turn-helix domain-containing protein [Halomonas zhuhanensis]